MKLIYCLKCHDVVRLTEQWRTCECARCCGRYEDLIHAVIAGPCVPLGISNSSLKSALLRPNPGPLGVEFESFIIPENASSVTRVKPEPKDPPLEMPRLGPHTD